MAAQKDPEVDSDFARSKALAKEKGTPPGIDPETGERAAITYRQLFNETAGDKDGGARAAEIFREVAQKGGYGDVDRKQWYASNRDILLEIKRQDYQLNKEHYNEISRKNWHAHKKRNTARRKIYEAANPDLIRFHKSQHEARKKNAVGSCTSGQWRQKCAYHGWRCIYCRVELAPKTVTTEHRKPLARGGSNWPANLGPCCAKCNQSKNNKSEKEYRAYICFQKLKVLSTAARVVIAKPRNATGLLPMVLRRT